MAWATTGSGSEETTGAGSGEEADDEGAGADSKQTDYRWRELAEALLLRERVGRFNWIRHHLRRITAAPGVNYTPAESREYWEVLARIAGVNSWRWLHIARVLEDFDNDFFEVVD